MTSRLRQWFPAAACTAGVVVVVVLLLAPISVSFGDDPVLRLEAFDRAPGEVQPSADCGPVPAALTRRSQTSDLFAVARDRACRSSAYRRVVVAGASGSLLVMAGLAALAARASSAGPAGPFVSREREVPPRPVPEPA